MFFLYREIGSGSCDSWLMPLQDEVGFLLFLQLNKLFLVEVSKITRSSTGKCGLQEGDTESSVLLFCIVSRAVMELVFQVKEMEELREGYSIIGLSQVCSC